MRRPFPARNHSRNLASSIRIRRPKRTTAPASS